MATKYITLSNLGAFLEGLKSNTKTVFGVNIWNNAITLGNGLTISNDDTKTVSLKTASDSELGGIQTGYTTSGKNYPVQLSSNKAYVNVPWTDEMVKVFNTENPLYLIGYSAKGNGEPHYMYTNKNSEVQFKIDGTLCANNTNAFIHQISINGDTKTTTNGIIDLGSYRYDWDAGIAYNTWSRICYIGQKYNTGAKFILNLSMHRDSVVYNDTFIISTGYYWKSSIIKIAGSQHTTGYKIRVVSINSYGNCYIEVLDAIQPQNTEPYDVVSIHCSLIPISIGDKTLYIRTQEQIEAGEIEASQPDEELLEAGYQITSELVVNKDNTQNIGNNVGGSAIIPINSAASTTISSLPVNKMTKITTDANTTGITINGFEIPVSGQVNQYYMSFNVAKDGIELTVPNSVKWANGVSPFFSKDETIEIVFSTIDNGTTYTATWAKYY